MLKCFCIPAFIRLQLLKIAFQLDNCRTAHVHDLQYQEKEEQLDNVYGSYVQLVFQLVSKDGKLDTLSDILYSASSYKA